LCLTRPSDPAVSSPKGCCCGKGGCGGCCLFGCGGTTGSCGRVETGWRNTDGTAGALLFKYAWYALSRTQFPSPAPNTRRQRLRASVTASFLLFLIASCLLRWPSALPQPTSIWLVPSRSTTRTTADADAENLPLSSRSTYSCLSSSIVDDQPLNPNRSFAKLMVWWASTYATFPPPGAGRVLTSSLGRFDPSACCMRNVAPLAKGCAPNPCDRSCDAMLPPESQASRRPFAAQSRCREISAAPHSTALHPSPPTQRALQPVSRVSTDPNSKSTRDRSSRRPSPYRYTRVYLSLRTVQQSTSQTQSPAHHLMHYTHYQ
jgi:hypothetical protein